MRTNPVCHQAPWVNSGAKRAACQTGPRSARGCDLSWWKSETRNRQHHEEHEVHEAGLIQQLLQRRTDFRWQAGLLPRWTGATPSSPTGLPRILFVYFAFFVVQETLSFPPNTIAPSARKQGRRELQAAASGDILCGRFVPERAQTQERIALPLFRLCRTTGNGDR